MTRLSLSLDIIDELLSHQNVEVYQKACEVRDYLDTEEGLDSDVGEKRPEANRHDNSQNNELNRN